MLIPKHCEGGNLQQVLSCAVQPSATPGVDHSCERAQFPWDLLVLTPCMCCAVPSKAYAGKNWLDHVNGCACCLTRTEGVSPCYLRAKGCQDFDTLDQCCWLEGLITKNKAGVYSRLPQRCTMHTCTSQMTGFPLHAKSCTAQ